jgi:hypothetical protein
MWTIERRTIQKHPVLRVKSADRPCMLDSSAFECSLELLQRAHGVVVSHPLSMREALGSIPSVSTILSQHETVADFSLG